MKYSRVLLLPLFLLVIATSFVCTVSAKDVWVQVRSKNFLLVGNASEKDIRKVGTRLEQFRETFRLLFSRANLSSSIQTNVVVFKNDASYRQFKPKRADGKIDNFIAGYFQPGEDVNYITLSVEGDDKETFGTIFHEYVHFIMETNYGKSEIPPWLNEGMAEYYQTFEIVDDQKVKLGLAQGGHLRLLQQYDLLPLSTLFNISNYQLHQTADHSRSIFYAESWALIHYLTFSGQKEGLNSFFTALLKGVPPDRAFQAAFQTTYEKMESELRRYVGKQNFNYSELTLKEKLTFDAGMQADVLDDADANAYLGDLLYHTNRIDDAESYLVNSLAQKPGSSMANATLGMVKFRQKKLVEAQKYLETAINSDGKNHIAFYRYALLISRLSTEDRSITKSISPDSVEKIRRALARAIELRPDFTESYELLAFVSLVTNDHLEDAINGLQIALKYQPGNQRYSLRIAEIYAVVNKFDDAETIARKIADTADEPEIRSRANSLIGQITLRRDIAKKIANDRRSNEAEMAKNLRNGQSVEDDPNAVVRSINEALRRPSESEKRIVGTIQKIDCRQRPLAFTIRSADNSVLLTSVDFETLQLGAFAAGSDKIQVGCDEDVSAFKAVITYRPRTVSNGPALGTLVAVEFVPPDFRFLDPLPSKPVSTSKDKIDTSSASGTLTEPPPGRNEEEEATRRRVMMNAIRENLPKPQAGQNREMGFVDRVDCGSDGIYFVIRTGQRTLRLLNSSPQNLRIGVFTPEVAGAQFGCSAKAIEAPAVFVYINKPVAASRADGEIISLSFVPRNFTLEP